MTVAGQAIVLEEVAQPAAGIFLGVQPDPHVILSLFCEESDSYTDRSFALLRMTVSELRVPRRFAPRDDGCGGIVAGRWVGFLDVKTARDSVTPTQPNLSMHLFDSTGMVLSDKIRKRQAVWYQEIGNRM